MQPVFPQYTCSDTLHSFVTFKDNDLEFKAFAVNEFNIETLLSE